MVGDDEIYVQLDKPFDLLARRNGPHEYRQAALVGLLHELHRAVPVVRADSFGSDLGYLIEERIEVVRVKKVTDEKDREQAGIDPVDSGQVSGFKAEQYCLIDHPFAVEVIRDFSLKVFTSFQFDHQDSAIFRGSRNLG